METFDIMKGAEILLKRPVLESERDEITGRAIMAYLEKEKDSLPALTEEEAIDKGLSSKNGIIWEDESKPEFWIRCSNGKIYQLGSSPE